MAKSQLKGTKKVKVIVSEENITILKNTLKAWGLIPLQSPDSIGKLHDEVVQICSNNSKNYGKDNLSKLLPYLVKIPHHVKEGLHLNLVNKLESSFDEYREADNFCDYILKEFQNIRDTIDKEFTSIFPIFNFLEYCRLIANTLKEDAFNALEYEKGKYINQVERFRNLAGHFRKFSTDLIRLVNKNEMLNEELDNMHILAKRVADMCDEKAQEIETGNRHITFMKSTSNKVFIVHGHDTAILLELKEILRNYGVEPIILNEMPDEGRTIIDNIEHYARSSCFAFVIITPDDLVENKGETYYQGRPNVFFELGWFCGRYGRSRVKILKKEGVKIPSDLGGITTLDFREKVEEVFRKIGETLKHSGIIE